MDKEIKMDKKIVRQANIQILRKVWRTYWNEKNTQGFYDLLGISDSTVDKFINTGELPKTWKYEDVAEKLRLNVDVFSGKYLIKINDKCMKTLCEDWETVKDKVIKLNSEEDNSRSKILESKIDSVRMQVVENEYKLWETIIRNKSGVKKSQWKEIHTELLREVAEQTKEEHFEDLQLWKFWDYIRKNK